MCVFGVQFEFKSRLISELTMTERLNTKYQSISFEHTNKLSARDDIRTNGLALFEQLHVMVFPMFTFGLTIVN